ncbi:MAG: hypothetical protein M3N45_16705 [Actinomycetota bacterium]|nr:hypothetical protein [Actinomycetota bacterium]
MPRTPGEVSYWQVGSGQGDREYSREFLDYGIAAVGDSGTMKKVRNGDIVVLRKGVKEIIAVGKVTEYKGQFKGCADAEDEGKGWLWDFDGWELPAYCYVEWRKLNKPEQIDGRMARCPICKIDQPEIRERAARILNEDPYPSRRDGPSPTRKIEDEEIQDLLGRNGLDECCQVQAHNSLM